MDALAEITPAATFIESRLRLGHLRKLMVLGLHFFYIKQAAPRPSEQAHGTRLALLLRLQRDNSLVIVYLGRCPRLYTVVENRLHLGHPSKLMALGLHCFCAFSARWLFVCSSNYHGRTCVGSAQILGCWEYPRSCLWQIAGGSCNRGSRPLRFPEPSLERKGRSFVRPGWLLYQLIAVGQSPSNGFSCCGITLQAARAVSATV